MYAKSTKPAPILSLWAHPSLYISICMHSSPSIWPTPRRNAMPAQHLPHFLNPPHKCPQYLPTVCATHRMAHKVFTFREDSGKWGGQMERPSTASIGEVRGTPYRAFQQHTSCIWGLSSLVKKSQVTFQASGDALQSWGHEMTQHVWGAASCSRVSMLSSRPPAPLKVVGLLQWPPLHTLQPCHHMVAGILPHSASRECHHIKDPLPCPWPANLFVMTPASSTTSYQWGAF